MVQGSDCFTYFMQWGLDKAVLRHIWEIVAGNSATLTQPQLTSCLYLMDAAKRGIRPPLKLPPGPFPPVVGTHTHTQAHTHAHMSAGAQKRTYDAKLAVLDFAS